MVAEVSEHTVHGVRLATVTPRRVRASCVVAMGFGAWLDAFEVQRFARLADQLEVRLVVVETPGLGFPGTALTRRERAALLSGRYSRLGRRMMAAALTHVDTSEPLHVMGYSMGASIAAAMASSRDAPPIASLVLVEPVATRAWNPLRLARAVREEDGLVDAYLDETSSVPAAVAPSDRTAHAPDPARNRTDQLLLGTALSWGRLAADIGSLAEHQPAPHLLVVHGSESVLSLPRDNEALVRALRSSGCHVTDVTMEGSHGLWQSLPRVDILGGHVQTFWSSL